MGTKHNHNEPWGPLSGYAKEYNPPVEEPEPTVEEEIIRMDEPRDTTSRVEIKLPSVTINAARWFDVIKWVCATILLVTALHAATAIFTNWNDNRTVEFVTLLVGPGQLPPLHDPRNGNNSL